LARLGHRNAEPAEFVGLVPPAYATDEPSVDEVVQDRYLFRQSQRLPDGQHQDPRGNLYALGLLADVESLQKWRGRITVVGEVVLGDETVVEPHLFRVLNLLNTFSVEGLPIPQVGIRPLIEKTKLHVCSPVLCCGESAYTGAVAVGCDCGGARRFRHRLVSGSTTPKRLERLRDLFLFAALGGGRGVWKVSSLQGNAVGCRPSSYGCLGQLRPTF